MAFKIAIFRRVRFRLFKRETPQIAKQPRVATVAQFTLLPRAFNPKPQRACIFLFNREWRGRMKGFLARIVRRSDMR
jgi:hypothetical protein